MVFARKLLALLVHARSNFCSLLVLQADDRSNFADRDELLVDIVSISRFRMPAAHRLYSAVEATGLHDTRSQCFSPVLQADDDEDNFADEQRATWEVSYLVNGASGMPAAHRPRLL
jgi:hypothetical protein